MVGNDDVCGNRESGTEKGTCGKEAEKAPFFVLVVIRNRTGYKLSTGTIGLAAC